MILVANKSINGRMTSLWGAAAVGQPTIQGSVEAGREVAAHMEQPCRAAQRLPVFEFCSLRKVDQESDLDMLRSKPMHCH